MAALIRFQHLKHLPVCLSISHQEQEALSTVRPWSNLPVPVSTQLPCKESAKVSRMHLPWFSRYRHARELLIVCVQKPLNLSPANSARLGANRCHLCLVTLLPTLYVGKVDDVHGVHGSKERAISIQSRPTRHFSISVNSGSLILP